MKKVLLTIVAALSLLAVSCNKNDEPKGNALVGEWSGYRDEGKQDVMVHFTFKADGTMEMVMPAWEEKRIGTYTDDGKKVSVKITKLEWLWDRGNGYVNVYDQYGCWFADDDWDKPAEERKKYSDPHAQWEKEWPDEVQFVSEYTFGADGTLTFSADYVGLNLTYYPDPDFVPQPMKRG